MSGKARANNRTSCQWVVARRPSSRPACARDERRPCRSTPDAGPAAIDLTRLDELGSIARRGKLSLPATMTVSADSIDAMASVTPNRAPIEVVTSRPSTDAILELVVGAEAVGFGEHLTRSRDVEHRHVVEDDDHHHARDALHRTQPRTHCVAHLWERRRKTAGGLACGDRRLAHPTRSEHGPFNRWKPSPASASPTPHWSARSPTTSATSKTTCSSTIPGGCFSSARCRADAAGCNRTSSCSTSAAMFHDIGLTARYRTSPVALRGRRRQRGTRFLLGTASTADAEQGVARHRPAHHSRGSRFPGARSRFWSPPASKPTCSASVART